MGKKIDQLFVATAALGSMLLEVLDLTQPDIAKQNQQLSITQLISLVSSATGLSYSSVLFVTVAGDDATGAVGDFNKPYKTITAAKTAASSNTLIVVYPGAYTDNSILKEDVSYYFYKGAIVSSTGTEIFQAVEGSQRVYGYGEFKAINVDCAVLGVGSGEAQNIYIEALKIQASGTTGYAVNVTGDHGEVHIDCREIIGQVTGAIYLDGQATSIGNITILNAKVSQLGAATGAAVIADQFQSARFVNCDIVQSVDEFPTVDIQMPSKDNQLLEFSNCKIINNGTGANSDGIKLNGATNSNTRVLFSGGTSIYLNDIATSYAVKSFTGSNAFSVILNGHIITNAPSLEQVAITWIGGGAITEDTGFKLLNY